MEKLPSTAAPVPADAGAETRQELFEQTWVGRPPMAPPPRWDDYLPPPGRPCTPEFVQTLIQTDIEFRIKAGLPALLAEPYFDHPRLQAPDAALTVEQRLELVRWEYQHRWKRGDRVPRRVYQERYFDLATALEALRPAWNCRACSRMGIPLGEETDEQVICRHCGAAFAVPELFATPPVAPTEVGPGGADTGLAPTIPGYDLGGELGRGGMGVVFRARDRRLDRDIAVKLLQDCFPTDSPEARRFVDEARIMGQLQHPGVPAVHEVGVLASGRPFMAMKLVKGRTLDNLLKERPGPAHERGRFVAAFEQVCQAVAYAHSLHVIHRDLKPSNVMVGAFGEVQVMDWGLAKVLTEEPLAGAVAMMTRPDAVGTRIRSARQADDHTDPDAALGTPAFSSPEQAGGEPGRVGPRTDVFGLGSVLCVILTGRPPYTGPTANAVWLKAVRGELAEALAALDGCGAEPELIALAKRCLAADPAERPANAGQVAAAVAGLRGEAEERARRAELDRAEAAVREAEWRKRRRVLLGAGGILAVVLLAGLAGTTRGMLQARRAKAAEVEAKNQAQADQARAETAEKETLADYRASTDDAIEELIGSKPELGLKERAYLEKTLKRWQAFADRKGDDEHSRAIRGEGHFNVAVQWQRLGYRAEARSEYEQAKDIRQKLVDDFPAVPAYRQELAGARSNLGVLLEGLGQRPEARAEYEAARDIYQKLADDFPAMPKYRQELALSHNNLGVLLEGLGQRSQARSEYEAARDIKQKLADDFPAVPKYRQALAVTRINLGNLLKGLAQRREARAEYEAARDIYQKLADVFPAVPAYRQELATTRNNLGNLLADLGQSPEARIEYEAARDIQQKLADAFPAVPAYRQELARTRTNLGVLLEGLGQRPEARSEYEAARDIQKGLADAFPAVPAYREELAGTRNNLGGLLADLGQRPEARAEYEAAREIQQKLADAFPAVPAYQIVLGGSYCNFGNLVSDEGKPADSLEWYDKAIATLSAVHQKEPRDVTAKQFLRNSHVGRARAFDRLGKFAQAVEDWDKAIELSPMADRPKFETARVGSLLQAGPTARAIADVAELTKATGWNAGQWYDFACFYAVASAKIAGKKQEYADRAMELLQKAVKAGFKDAAHMAKDTDLDPLRGRDDFKRLLESLGKGTDTKSPSK